MQHALAGKKFADYDEIRIWVTNFLDSRPAHFFKNGIPCTLDKGARFINDTAGTPHRGFTILAQGGNRCSDFEAQLTTPRVDVWRHDGVWRYFSPLPDGKPLMNLATVLPADIVTWFVRDVAVLVFDMLSPLREVRTEESADAVTVLSAYP
ncbi:unnamed protein product [Heligmosomoides polygyrus]|uniref:DUF1214 domain-containing protein n=1 Tax=Heligmosomoides polygyrus TaxID=6339 RepID=A0A183G5V1_HELPZ|nr:unnamed protein product [Heligmosomoides polygyrus]